MEKILNLVRKMIPKKLFGFAQPAYHFLLALSGNIVYRFPGRRMICIGVTGTNGKSTTIEIANSVLKAGGFKTGMISTVAFEIDGERKDNVTQRTTLGRWQTPKMLRRMVKAGCRYAILEVASEGVVQYRTWGIPFDVAVFTNLSPEHLNTHGTMTNYRNAKGKLFESMAVSKRKKNVPKVSIVNADDRQSKYFSAFPADSHLEYGLKKGRIRAKNIVQGDEISFDIEDRGKHCRIRTELLGRFNVTNILAAWCIGYSQGLDPKKIKQGIEAVGAVKGRMEKVAEGNGVKYFIDYAMTPDSYEMLFGEMKNIAEGKVIAVFGAAGDRDRGKRPAIGEIAAKGADFTILTDDEPYSEEPREIIAEIEAGFKKQKKKNYRVVSDRREAFLEAKKMARPGDVVVVPGIGHQSYRNVGGTRKIPWNEAKIIRELVEKSS